MREERMPLIQDRVPSNLQRATSEYGSSTNGGGQVQAVRMGIRIFIITLVAIATIALLVTVVVVASSSPSSPTPSSGELNTTIAPPSASSQVTVPSTIEVTPVTSEVAPSSTAEVTVPSTVEVTPVASEVNAPSSTEVNASSSASISAQPVISSSTELSDGPASTTPLKDSVPGLIIVPDDTNPKKLPAPLALPVLQAALSQALQGAQKQLEQTRDAIRTGKVVLKGSPSAKHGHRLRPVLPPAKQKHWQALALNLASQEIAKVAKDNNITTDDDFWDSLPQVGPPDTCDLDPEPVVCDEDAVKYRRVDGRCNNLRNPLWGSTMSTYRRLLPPDYADGVGLPRVASDGTDLPSARTVRTTVHPNQYHGSAFFTNIAMVWGQIVDHDVTLTNSFSVAPAGLSNTMVDCCTDAKMAQNLSFCYPIYVDPNDEFLGPQNVTCYNIIRSAPAPSCNFGVRKQSNGQTSFLDGSIIYGSTVEQQVIVRAFSEGKMLITNSDEGTGDLLPVSKELNDGCNKEDEFSKGNYCFLSGDLRVNEMLSLASVHTLLVREHNRVATELLRLNPSWDDEKTYQEARKIVSAQIQHITYNELLPIILGKNLSKYNIDLAPAGTYFEGYDDDADPTITAAFAAAAYRFGHSMIQGLVKLDRQMNGSREVDWIQLKDLLFHPFSLHQPGTMDAVLRGQVDQETQEVDPYFTNQVTDHLFQSDNQSYGFDLVATNLQRGRDVGLPGYMAWRRFCKLSTVQTFDDLIASEDTVPSKIAYLFSKLYKNVDDIDLYTAGISEEHVPGSIVGPTFHCLLSYQFYRMRVGDRFWYENPENGFTMEQLDSIRKTTLARLICENSEVTEIPIRAMEKRQKTVTCSEIPAVDLSKWEDFDLSTNYTRNTS